jgi:ornithine cyclodeaminase/alanine dehydrogenase-like protein (mu-crystallin family)
LTRLRTAAATAVAIRHLAKPDAGVLTLIGCGSQAFEQVRFADHVRPLRRVIAHDVRTESTALLVDRIQAELGLAATVGEDLASSCEGSDIIVTCTTALVPVLANAWVPTGALVVGVGADNPHKHELESRLLAEAIVITDDTSQCAEIGDLHHAITAGAMTRDQVHAELGAVVAGRSPGRTDPAERIVFDSTGIPIQDAAACGLVLAQLDDHTALSTFSFRE